MVVLPFSEIWQGVKKLFQSAIPYPGMLMPDAKDGRISGFLYPRIVDNIKALPLIASILY
jgi:hypothetical protein